MPCQCLSVCLGPCRSLWRIYSHGHGVSQADCVLLECCRLDQLLALGSLIFKEESGYYAFYHHLLKPYQHYVPFWKQVSRVQQRLTTAVRDTVQV